MTHGVVQGLTPVCTDPGAGLSVTSIWMSKVHCCGQALRRPGACPRRIHGATISHSAEGNRAKPSCPDQC